MYNTYGFVWSLSAFLSPLQLSFDMFDYPMQTIDCQVTVAGWGAIEENGQQSEKV